MTRRIKLHNLPSIRRLPRYLHLLKRLQQQGVAYVSAPKIADVLGLAGIQVRKDLALTGIVGKPRVGYEVSALVEAIVSHLGWDQTRQAVLVGAGSLGTALLGYGGFTNFGLRIVSAFDASPTLINREIHGITIRPAHELGPFIEKNAIRIGILTVSPAAAQSVTDTMVNAGIRAIWNFVPAPLTVPERVIIQNEDLACGLSVLSLKLDIARTEAEK
ncbi:MAG: redox-sensing transcriptional repressor Rex [Lentisphaeria bacterium]|nr:redox-sensing transcriptional repressor Rex [Lentisphaeria bacterium]